MRSTSAVCVVLVFGLSISGATVRAEDSDISLRIQAIGESAEKARIETARKIKEDADRRARELEVRLAEVEKWTTAQFELGERGVIDKPKVMSELMTRWQSKQANEIFRLLQFADKSQGPIESGRALNILLARVGPAAHQNQQTRRVDPAGALPLHASSANEQISEEMFEHLTIQDKLLGPRDSRRGNADPIDIDWPAILRDERWADHRGAVEQARKRVLDEMATTDGISSAADKELRDAVGALNVDFIEYRKHWRDHVTANTPETADMEYRRVYEGGAHVRKLIGSVYFILQAKNLADLPQREEYHGGNVEEFLSYMVRNNLQFGTPSKAADRSTYHKVFNLMVRYYLDENAMAKLQQQLEQELDDHKQLSREAADVALGKVMSANMQAAQNIAEMNFIRELIKD